MIHAHMESSNVRSRIRKRKLCGVEECPNIAYDRGVCKKHHQMSRMSGDLCGLTIMRASPKEVGKLMKQGKAKCYLCKRVLAVDEFKPSDIANSSYRCRKCNSARINRERYDATQDQVRKMLRHQHGRCGICNRKFSEITLSKCIDHKHSSGYVRGLLCNRCNVGIGMFRDNAALMYNAAQYINKAEVREAEEARG